MTAQELADFAYYVVNLERVVEAARDVCSDPDIQHLQKLRDSFFGLERAKA